MAEIALRDYVAEIEALIEGSAYDEAIAHCRHILAQQPKCLDAYRLVAKASLEKEDHVAAADIFQRVLSVDPQDFVARVGLSIACDRQGRLDEALWQMERGFELQPSNDVIQTELKHLYGRRDGIEPERIGLTRGALARMYAQGDLYTEAIAELRALLTDAPERVDLQVLLAEALWRDDQRSEAADAAERVLGRLPYCLNANLLLAEIFLTGGIQADGEAHLRRAQDVDPDNARAAALLGSQSPIAERATTVTRLEYYARPAAAPESASDQVPDWLAGLAGMALEQPESAGAPALPEPATEPAIEPGPASSEVELPAWLFEGAPVTTEADVEPEIEVEASDWMRSLMDQTQAPETTQIEPAEAPATPTPAPEEELPEWMRVLSEQVQPPAAPAEAAPMPPAEPLAVPDWLAELGVTEAPEAPPTEVPTPDWLSEVTEAPAAGPAEPEAGLPAWLSDLGVTPAPAEAAEAPPAGLEQAELPDWLQSLRPPEPETAAPVPQVEVPEVEESEIPEWLALAPEAPATDEALDFLQRLGEGAEIEPEAPAGVEEMVAFDVEPKHVPPTPPEPAAPPPAVVPEGMPSADEALAFLASLTVGKEEELRAQAEREGEARMEAIMGGKPGTSPLRPRAEEAVAPTELPPEPAAPAPTPAVPEGMPSADEALAFLESLTVGKEEELRAQAEREGVARMEAILGGKPGTSPLRPKREVAPPEPVAEAPEAVLDFTADLAYLEGLEAVEVEAPALSEVEGPAEAPIGISEEMAPGGEIGVTPPEILEVPAEIAVEVPAPALSEVEAPALSEVEGPAEAFVVDYWLQTAVDEGVEPIADDYFAPKPKAAPRAVTPRPKKTRPAERAVQPPAEPEHVLAPEAATGTPLGSDEYLSRLQADPEDWEACLALARIWWAAGRPEPSLPLYQRLIERDQFLVEVAGDLERSLEAFENPGWYRALGDARMKLGNLSKALEAYRQALTHL